MDLVKLKIFRDIAYERSFVKAAKLNFITQPAVSSHLKALEEELGEKLFERVPRKVVITKAGELLLPHAEELLQKSNNLKHLISQLNKTPKGDVRLATVYSVGIYELTPLLKNFIKSNPDVNVHFQYRIY